MRFKRIIALLLTLLLIVSALASCKKNNQGSVSPTEDSGSSSGTVATDSSLTPAESSESSTTPDLSMSDPTASVSVTPSGPVTPSISEDPTSEEPRDTDFDLVPTGVFSKKYPLSELHAGNLVLINDEFSFDASLAGFPLVREHRTGNIQVSTYYEQLSKDALEALDALEKAFKKETESEKNLIIKNSFPYAQAEELKDEGKTSHSTTEERFSGLSFAMYYYDGATYPLNYYSLKKESLWLTQNLAKYGFVFRYTSGKESLTGKNADVNYLRYVGIPHATYMFQNNLCLEEYIERVKEYGPDNRLVITDAKGYSWSVYYMKSESSGAELLLPKDVVYEISGNNVDGYIITVKSSWEGDMTGMVDAVNVTGITVTQPATSPVSAYIGGTVDLEYRITPENATNQKVTFHSSDAQVASVSQDGKISALKEGTATITVRTVDGNFSASVDIVVKENTAPTVWIDAGHGCYNSVGILDVGAGEGSPFFNASGGLYESDLNMQIARQVQEILRAAGYNVLMTRDGDRKEHVTVGERAEEANAAMADVFVSIHANSAAGSAKGARSYHYADHPLLEKCLKLNQEICKAINATENCSSTTVSPDTAEYAVLTHTNMPSVLVETCFLTSESDAQKAVTEEWCTGMAQAIATGIMACYPIAG